MADSYDKIWTDEERSWVHKMEPLEGHKITEAQLRQILSNQMDWGWTEENLGEDYLRVFAAMINAQFSKNQIDDFEKSH
jgi:hypothetical protein